MSREIYYGLEPRLIKRHVICKMASIRILQQLLIIFSCFLYNVAAERFGVTRDNSGKYNLLNLDGNSKAANPSAEFDDTKLASTGWMKFVVNGSVDATTNASELAFKAGYLEGRLTAKYIYMHFQNTYNGFCKDQTPLCKNLTAFIINNYDWAMLNTLAYPSDPYWFQVGLFYNQFFGLVEGYGDSGEPEISRLDLMVLQLAGDLEDLQEAFSEGAGRVQGSGSCSAFVKLGPLNSDLFFTHDTWDDYHSMLRIFKCYDMAYPLSDADTRVIPGAKQSFSSYPGILMSGDDFYILSSGLATMETTIGNMNKELWKYITFESVMEGVRTIVANRLAINGLEWCQIFQKHNSGTYNNQWMIADYKKFRKHIPRLQSGTFYILEQIPGKIEYRDMSAYLQQERYWGSYNIPYFEDIYNASGWPAQAAKYGAWFTYHGSPRARIFARDQSKAVDINSVIHLMRYNDFMHDNLSVCNCTPPYSGENGISARSDLNPANGTYPFGALGHRCHGGTDNKIVGIDNFEEFSVIATCGPTFQELPPFNWSKTEWKRPLGHPEEFKFKPTTIKF